MDRCMLGQDQIVDPFVRKRVVGIDMGISHDLAAIGDPHRDQVNPAASRAINTAWPARWPGARRVICNLQRVRPGGVATPGSTGRGRVGNSQTATGRLSV